MATLENNWMEMQAAWISWVEKVTGRNAMWRDDRQFAMDPNPHFLLHIQAISERGIPGITYQFDAASDALIPRQQVMLNVTLEISCIANNQRAGNLAQQEMTRLKSKTYLPGFRDVLCEAGINLTDSRDILSIPFEHQGRLLSQATSEFLFNVMQVSQDTSNTVSYIESVNTADNCVDTSEVFPEELENGLFTEDLQILLDENGVLLIE